MLETQAEPTQVTSQTIEMDLGLEVIQEQNTARNVEISVEEDRMDLDTMIGGKEVAEEDFQELTEEELEEEEGVPRDLITAAEEEKQGTLKEGKERAPGDNGKK